MKRLIIVAVLIAFAVGSYAVKQVREDEIINRKLTYGEWLVDMTNLENALVTETNQNFRLILIAAVKLGRTGYEFGYNHGMEDGKGDE